MKFIVYSKKTNEFIDFIHEEPIIISNTFGVARCETIPKGKKFMVTNIQEKQEEYTEKVTETVTLVTGEKKEIIKAVTKTRNYYTCDLIGE